MKFRYKLKLSNNLQVDNYKMFRPNLKRSQITQIFPVRTSVRYSSQKVDTKQKVLLYQKTKGPQLYMPSLFQKQPNKTQQKLTTIKKITPLKFWDVEYPIQVKQIMNLSPQQAKTRLLGSKYGVYWLITRTQLYLWRYDSFDNPNKILTSKKYNFPKNIRTISIGHLDKQECLLFNYKQNNEFLAIGFQFEIQLYSINLLNLQLNTTDIRMRVSSNQALQHIFISDNNQIYYTGSQGFLTRVSFNNNNCLGKPNVKKSIGRPSIFSFKSFWQTLNFGRTNIRIITQNIISMKNKKIYVLIRKQSQGTTFSKLSKSFKNFFSGRIHSDEQSNFIQKQIHVYQVIEPNNSLIKLKGIIKNSQIQQKIKENYTSKQPNQYKPQFTYANKYQTSTLLNIFIDKTKKDQQNQQQILAIVTNYGYYLRIKQNVNQSQSNLNNFSFQQLPKKLPQELYVKTRKQLSASCFLNPIDSNKLPKSQQQTQQNQLQPLAQKQFPLIQSFGLNNLNFLSNGLCFYFDQNQIQILKLQKYPGFFMEYKTYPTFNKIAENKTWLVFSKNQITIIRKSQPYQFIVSSLATADQLHKIAVAKQKADKRQKQQYPQKSYLHYASQAIRDIVDIVGSNQISNNLCKLLIKIIREKAQRMNQFYANQPLIYTTQLVQQMMKQQYKFRVTASAKLKYKNLPVATVHNLFTRWLMTKRKSVQLRTFALNPQIQDSIWRFFLIYSFENNDGSEKIVSYTTIQNQKGEKINFNIPYFSYWMINLFKQCYKPIKNMKILQIQKSSLAFTQIKTSLLTLIRFLQQKKSKSYKLTAYKLQRKQKNLSQQIARNDGIKKNQSENSTYNSSNPNINSFSPDPSYSEAANQHISNQLQRVIPNLINVIQIYELIASNIQRLYENIPTIHQFMQNYSARKQVKAIVLDIFSSTNLQTNPTILKLHNILPELGLQADIYLAKWINFIKRSQNYQRQFEINSTISRQIRSSDLLQFSRILQIEHILKVKCLFKHNQIQYLQILINQLQFRKSQLQMIYQKIRFKNQQLKAQQTVFNIFQIKIFEWDKQKLHMQWVGQLNTQINLIRNQINNFLQELAIMINLSTAAEFDQLNRTFDESTKIVVDQTVEGIEFIKNLIDFLKQKNLMPEKIYSLSFLTKDFKNKKSILQNLIPVIKPPQFLSSLDYIDQLSNKNQKQIFENINMRINRERTLIKDNSIDATFL